jgi:D-3-phosphoglycerate dehydrogenase
MLGRVGTELGAAGVNIISAAVGRRPEDDGEAAMVVTADTPVPNHVVDSLASSDGFLEGRAVSL